MFTDIPVITDPAGRLTGMVAVVPVGFESGIPTLIEPEENTAVPAAADVATRVLGVPLHTVLVAGVTFTVGACTTVTVRETLHPVEVIV
jgi:hypothetical protein